MITEVMSSMMIVSWLCSSSLAPVPDPSSRDRGTGIGMLLIRPVSLRERKREREIGVGEGGCRRRGRDGESVREGEATERE